MQNICLSSYVVCLFFPSSQPYLAWQLSGVLSEKPLHAANRLLFNKLYSSSYRPAQHHLLSVAPRDHRLMNILVGNTRSTIGGQSRRMRMTGMRSGTAGSRSRVFPKSPRNGWKSRKNFLDLPRNHPRGAIFPKICKINQSNVDVHCKILTWLVYWIRTARSVFTGAELKWPNTAGQYSICNSTSLRWWFLHSNNALA